MRSSRRGSVVKLRRFARGFPSVVPMFTTVTSKFWKTALSGWLTNSRWMRHRLKMKVTAANKPRCLSLLLALCHALPDSSPSMMFLLCFSVNSQIAVCIFHCLSMVQSYRMWSLFVIDSGRRVLPSSSRHRRHHFPHHPPLYLLRAGRCSCPDFFCKLSVLGHHLAVSANENCTYSEEKAFRVETASETDSTVVVLQNCALTWRYLIGRSSILCTVGVTMPKEKMYYSNNFPALNFLDRV